MRKLFFLATAVLGPVMSLSLCSCASSNAPLQSRIESKIQTPSNSNVEIGTAHYNKFSQGFEEPWPFGPYSTFLIIQEETNTSYLLLGGSGLRGKEVK